MEPRADEPDDDAPEILARVRPLDPRRLREIRHWFEGKRPDAPTREELSDFVDWLYQEIESALARRRPTDDLLVLLNASREELRRAAPDQSLGSM